MLRMTRRVVAASCGRRRLWVVGCVVALLLAGVPGALPAGAGEVDLAAAFNNVGIAQDPFSAASFDGAGWSYSAQALRVGDPQGGYAGVAPGGQVPSGGFSFTWPNRPSGAPDNVVASGQTIAVPLTPGATKIGFLGASDHGPLTGAFTFNSTYVDADGVTRHVAVLKDVTFSDWTLNAATTGPSEGNVVVMRNLFRAANSTEPQLDAPHVFVVSVPLDPGLTLESVTLPVTESGQIHLFGMSVV